MLVLDIRTTRGEGTQKVNASNYESRMNSKVADTRKSSKVVNICGSNVDAIPERVKRKRRPGNPELPCQRNDA